MSSLIDHLTLGFGQGGRRGVDVDQGEMRLAVLLDPVGEGLDAPIFDLADRAAEAGHDGLELLGQGFRLLGGQILTSKENVLVKSHVLPFSMCSLTSKSECAAA